MPHVHYCLLVWGSNVKDGHKLHLLQKKAIRVISNSHYIAHTEPICKRLHMLKVSDMFRLAIWKFYYKLMNNKLPSYFNYMKPNLPVICNYYGIRKLKFHLPIIRHVFAEQLIQYNLIRIINDDIESVGIMDVVLTQSFCAFKSNIKHRIISTYSEKCVAPFLLANIHNYCLLIGMTYCVHSKKNLSAYIVLACLYGYILEVYLRIFTFSSFS